MAPEELLQPGTVLNGTRSDYTILNLIGRGGMGAVYRARREADDTVWALKEMRPPPNTPPEDVEENRRLFEQEAELMGQLSHPNLLVLGDRFECAGRPIMVMEYVPGQTLEDRIRDANAPLLEQQALIYGIQLCRVLHYLHTRTPPVIYRDLKPPNIMITPQGVVKLIDFGVARTYKERKTKDTIAMGSAGYAPPEQYGKGQTDPRSDIYALGATLLHLLTNLPPVPLQTPQVGYLRKLNPSVDAETEQVIIKAMSLDRDKRYRDCMQMEQELQARLEVPYVDPTATAAPPPVEPPPPVTPTPVAPTPAPQPVPIAPPATVLAAGTIQTPMPNTASSAPVAPPTPNYAAAPVPGLACNSCGYVNKPQARFCANCGSALNVSATAHLLIKSPRSTWDMRIDDDLTYRIGRRDPSQSHYPELDLAEHDRGVASRHHATIKRNNHGYVLTDLGSTNGTFLNGQRLAAYTPQRLRTGDQIKIGEVEIEFRWV